MLWFNSSSAEAERNKSGSLRQEALLYRFPRLPKLTGSPALLLYASW
ncbi:hypothetical protein IVA79_08135 [Bradyrhizobium sp. 138]|nr:hypothetical protein [Bradyrhizobium sp. 138]MCK1733924.1 hypothetical protein [Bradyrhizobium sp. 138]